MTDQRALKQKIRARAERTGESYVTARRHVTNSRADAGAGATGEPLVLEQAERLVELGVHELAGIHAQDLRTLAGRLARRAASVEVDTLADADDGSAPWVLVVPGIDPGDLMPLVQARGRAGYVDMSPSTPDRFSVIDSVEVPEAPIYLLRSFDPGDSLRNLPPSAAMQELRAAGREPLTIDEAVCAAVLVPDLLARKHAFSILASRSEDGPVLRSVPALWISRGAPRLGWCWNENPHTWLGSGSCAERIAP
jgi:hypothetical protein